MIAVHPWKKFPTADNETGYAYPNFNSNNSDGSTTCRFKCTTLLDRLSPRMKIEMFNASRNHLPVASVLPGLSRTDVPA